MLEGIKIMGLLEGSFFGGLKGRCSALLLQLNGGIGRGEVLVLNDAAASCGQVRSIKMRLNFKLFLTLTVKLPSSAHRHLTFVSLSGAHVLSRPSCSFDASFTWNLPLLAEWSDGRAALRVCCSFASSCSQKPQTTHKCVLHPRTELPLHC